MGISFRPPAVPLVTVDPYFNVWSMADNLYDDNTRHWTGQSHGMAGIIWIDGTVYRFMGTEGQCQVMPQKGLQVLPLSSIYTFEANGVQLKVDFTTPLFLDDLDLLSRPASYITFDVQAVDGKEHRIKIYFHVTGEWCVNSPDQKVEWSRGELEDNAIALRMGTQEQPILEKDGDNIRIDWGYLYLLLPQANNAVVSSVIQSQRILGQFITSGGIEDKDDTRMPRSVNQDMPVMASTIDFGLVGNHKSSYFLVLAYDDIYSVEYFNKKLTAYWRRNGMTIDEMLLVCIKEYYRIIEKCVLFNNELVEEGIRAGGSKYAQMLSLAYRQSIAAHKLVDDEEGNILFLSKECFSNGCMGTVDVSYPSIPLYLLYNPELVKGMLRPIFRYAGSSEWTFNFAPHDVGRYPKANGQVYGNNQLERQMPVEECGNMLIMTAAVCLAEGNTCYAEANWTYLTQWAEYLKNYGLDPGNQLCTDDFAGHLAHNVNLSIKAIIGIACYGVLCRMLGKDEEMEQYMKIVRDMAKEWENMADDGEHYRLTFNSPDTWSQKYNLVWDSLIGLNLFNPEIARKEVNCYIKKQNRYGTPLDCRDTYTKADWLVWSATLAENYEDFRKLIEPIWDFLNDTPCRVPFTDWYDTVSGYQTRCMCHSNKRGFRNRSVIGGIFIKLLKDKGILQSEGRRYKIRL